MTRVIGLFFIILFSSSIPVEKTIGNKDKVLLTSVFDKLTSDPIASLYEELGLQEKLNFDIFEKALLGYEQLSAPNKDIFSIIDFTKPSSEKRLFVIDIKNKKVLYHSLVSHGRNSGDLYAKSFSNKHGSYQSSVGFYETSNTYFGGNGFSLRLEGLERNINDQARARAIVIHGADYCSEDFIKRTGRLGRSYGCPALPRELNKPIINTIKQGSLLFIYADEPTYFANSEILKKGTKRKLLAELPTPQQENTAQAGVMQ
ncbi:MAG TPA: murein L,D-transpeptidase catalytic domain family protein [Candidatus Sphingobacterium stercoripullorum]|uniref:Murein L,D-transpeptidase catalytic domain family protein n=1 Tax=Candidatus Sphingobacterium stercoripullorum TaxID=2838759 RepID=A0A9D1WAH4_9SPHI|nr:murein L,D-transpeptidase catalytic domain family protein [Candidatus Sphingobacterium stercoripullorum]HLR51007.1 murein L,D-transpeptidase catalytic domain family protein [Candidatus Sphingobacterium stercoripullorum]